MQQTDGLILNVVAPFYEEIDWDDLESTRNHNTEIVYNRTKTMNRMITGGNIVMHMGK